MENRLYSCGKALTLEKHSPSANVCAIRVWVECMSPSRLQSQHLGSQPRSAQYHNWESFVQS